MTLQWAPDLVLDEETHVYRMRGEVVPGVTQILRPLWNLDAVRADVLEAKRDLGRRVHLACQLDDENDLDESSVEDDVAPYLDAWRLFLRESGAVLVHNERSVFDPLLRFAGTLDNVLDYRQHRWCVDKKTSIVSPRSVGPQTAAYVRALGDHGVTRRAAIRLRPDGKYRFDPLDDPEDWPTFLACLQVYRFKETHP